MKEPVKALKVTDNVYWVGAIDWGIREFHGYATQRGTTYNAYLVLADKITLIDTVKGPFKDEMLSRIASVIDPKDIDLIVSNHSEMDHSGCLPEIIKELKPQKVLASNMGVKALSAHFQMDREIVAVKNGESLSLGNMNLSFIETRMLHWPDSMFTYLTEDQLLFSQDGFGMHLATAERFTEEISEEIVEHEAIKYYANILMPFSTLIINILKKLESLNLSIKIIAPDHGPIWRKDPKKIVKLYSKWAAQQPTDKAVIVYDTMWQSTAAMARAIGEGLTAGGTHAQIMPLKSSHRSDIATEVLLAGALMIGSPTINNTMFPTVADILTYLKGLKPRNLIGAAFGSYGWSGEAVKQVTEELRAMKVDLVSEGLKAPYVPDKDRLTKCYSLGIEVAKKLTG
jgi:flavorubredoxin